MQTDGIHWAGAASVYDVLLACTCYLGGQQLSHVCCSCCSVHISIVYQHSRCMFVASSCRYTTLQHTTECSRLMLQSSLARSSIWCVGIETHRTCHQALMLAQPMRTVHAAKTVLLFMLSTNIFQHASEGTQVMWHRALLLLICHRTTTGTS